MLGMESFMVNIEADVTMGKSRFDMVGLPDTAVNESKERVRAAIKNSGFAYPEIRKTINLAPADVRKEGPIYDLPILMAILIASKQIKPIEKDSAFVGELSLGGDVKHINGVLPMVIEARNNGIKQIFIPEDNKAEASVVDGITIYPVKNVRQLINHINNEELISPVEFNIPDIDIN